MMERISDHVWKIKGNCNIYFLDLDEKIIIDTGNRSDADNIKEELSNVIDPDLIDKVIFTHLHYDHIGNFDLFRFATFHASAEEIGDFKENPLAAILRPDIVEEFDLEIKEIPQINKLTIISTPGHTRGSISIWYEEEKILFSGDTIFANGSYGRTDLPTSVPEELEKSISKLKEYKYEILCPGHDY